MRNSHALYSLSEQMSDSWITLATSSNDKIHNNLSSFCSLHVYLFNIILKVLIKFLPYASYVVTCPGTHRKGARVVHNI